MGQLRLTSSGHVVVILVNKDMLRALCEYILKDSVLICTSNPAFILSVLNLNVTVVDAKEKLLHSRLQIQILEPFWRCVQAIENQSAHVTFPEMF